MLLEIILVLVLAGGRWSEAISSPPPFSDADDATIPRSTDTLRGLMYPCPTRIEHRHLRTLLGHSQTHVEHIDNMKKLGYIIDSCRMHITMNNLLLFSFKHDPLKDKDIKQIINI